LQKKDLKAKKRIYRRVRRARTCLPVGREILNDIFSAISAVQNKSLKIRFLAF